jgi:hypothetical protein
MTSGAVFGYGDRDLLRALLIAPNGNLADDCEYVNEGVYRGDNYSVDSGISRPMGDDPSRWVVSSVRPRLEKEEFWIEGNKSIPNSAYFETFRASLWKSLSNSEGNLSAEPPKVDKQCNNFSTSILKTDF